MTAADLFEMGNLFPRSTGLPMTVWVKHRRSRARHAARVRVNMMHGDGIDLVNYAVVGINPQASLISGCLYAEDTWAVFRWIDINRNALNDLWDGKIDFVELAARLVKI